MKPTATPAQEVKTQTAARQKATAQSGSKVTTAPERSVAASVTGGSQMESYIVRKGDTLSQIVWRQYHSFDLLDRVKNTNRIKNSDEIYIGQCILLPEP
ncbi:MAG: LysM peptidoglycan-binding domain-containing protein [Lachnospiraceae bacterium]